MVSTRDCFIFGFVCIEYNMCEDGIFYLGTSIGSSCVCRFLVFYIFIIFWLLFFSKEGVKSKSRYEVVRGRVTRIGKEFRLLFSFKFFKLGFGVLVRLSL